MHCDLCKIKTFVIYINENYLRLCPECYDKTEKNNVFTLNKMWKNAGKKLGDCEQIHIED